MVMGSQNERQNFKIYKTDQMTKIINPEIVEMLRESNYIEEELSEEALEDAIKAWEFARENDDVSFEWLLEIHRLLMRRLNPRIAGKLRGCDVWIGGRHCRFISYGLLKSIVTGKHHHSL